MSLITYPLDDIDYDFNDAALFHSTRTSGIYAGEDFSFSVTGADNMVTLGPGLAWMRLGRFKGICTAMKNEAVIDFGLPDAVYPRIDHLVLQYSANKNGVEVLVLKGSAASSPLAPERSELESLYELHLLEIRREPGAVAISASDVTDLRLDPNWCGLMADSVTAVDTTAINVQFQSLLAQIRQELLQLEAGTAVELKKLEFSDIQLPVSAFSEITDPTEEELAIVEAGYGYKASLALEGMLSSMIPEVRFSIPVASSGIFAPGQLSYNGGICFYASDVPAFDVTIPTIYCLRGNA